jgi:outer membrane lipoprotein-sorting protein
MTKIKKSLGEEDFMNIIKNIILGMMIIFICATNAFSQDANEILKQVDVNLTPDSFEAYRKIVNEEPDGKKKEFIFYTIKKGKSKIAMLYLAPAGDKGRTALRIGDDMWLYIPNVGKPIRTTSSQSLTGGIFNNADILQLEYNVEYDASLLEQDDTEYILELKAKSRAIAYDQLKMWVTRDALLVTKIECYSASKMLIKTLDFKEIKDLGAGMQRPSVIETYSPLHKGYRSIMIYGKMTLRDFPDEVFTLSFLPKLEELR